MVYFIILPLACNTLDHSASGYGDVKNQGKTSLRYSWKVYSCPCNVKPRIQNDSRSKVPLCINAAVAWVTPLQPRSAEIRISITSQKVGLGCLTASSVLLEWQS